MAGNYADRRRASRNTRRTRGQLPKHPKTQSPDFGCLGVWVIGYFSSSPSRVTRRRRSSIRWPPIMLWLSQRQLGSKDPAVRRKAMQELCQAPDARALAAFRTALADDDVEVRRLATTALAKLEDDNKIEPLLTALRDRDPEVVKTAITGLKRSIDPNVIAAIAPLVRNVDAGVRGHAGAALEAAGWKPTRREDEIWFAVSRNQFLRAAACGTAAIPALESVLSSGPYNFRVAAVEALGKIDDDRALRPLLSALKSPDSSVCVAAIDVLTKRGEAQAIPGIISLLRHKEPAARVAATESLGRLGAKQAIEPLRSLLKDPSWDVRRATAETLGRLKDAKSVEALSTNLNDLDADVREATALALGSLSDRRAIGALVKSLKDSTSGVRRIAAAALSRIDEDWSASPEAQVAIEELKTSLTDKDPDVRYLVGRLLVSLGQAAPESAALPPGDATAASTPEKRRKLAVSLFAAVLCDADRDLRQAAAEALGRLGDPRAQSALARAMTDADTGVRVAAEAALKSLPARAPA
ncbi:MAG: hypothetical protein EXS35_03560 [Pedosphaera sp.]|nr:hypothetical protein [Pedosphaera sp.]